MGDDRSRDLVGYARELEERDRDAAARIDAVAAVLRIVDELRARATQVMAGLDAIPAEIEHAERDERDARAREADARAELDEAKRRLEDVQRSRRAGAEAREHAERAVRRAAVTAGDAATAVARARERLEAVIRTEAALQAEGEGLAVEARDAAAAVSGLSRVSDSGRSAPGGTVAEIAEWGARVHAALFVVRGGLESERERIVLEANGLAAAAIGDQGGSASVALVRRRLEEALGRG